VFASPPQFRVLAGRREIGSVGVEVLLDTVGTRLILLAGRSWKVTHIDWRRRQGFVEEVAGGGKAKWASFPAGLSFQIASGMKAVVLGELPVGVDLSRRAVEALLEVRADLDAFADPDRLVLQRTAKGDWRWWTWGGLAANRTLAPWLPDLVDPTQRLNELWLRLHADLPGADIQAGLARARANLSVRPLPPVDRDALNGLKFSESLPPDLAADTAARRLVAADGASAVLAATTAAP